ncbi:hypothetical protein MP638_006147, partial [Amoeboaphelidium occidentale]
MTLQGLPTEKRIRNIAQNLDYLRDLSSFQESSSNIRKATSDVSFYVRYFTNREIFMRDCRIGQSVVERLYDYPSEFAQFFYENAKTKIYVPESYVSAIAKSEVELIGFEIGILFSEFEEELYLSDEKLTVVELHERMSKLKEENPVLAKNPYWHSFENLLF